MNDELRPTSTGLGLVLIAVYGILALAALGRSGYQIATKFDEAPVAYALSALAAVVYLVATVALLGRAAVWLKVAAVAIAFELAGVLIVGKLSLIDPTLFPDDTVWSQFGRGYAFVPLVLPVIGLVWLRRVARARRAAMPSGPAEPGAGVSA